MSVAAPWCASAYAAQSASLLTCTGQRAAEGAFDRGWRPGRRRCRRWAPTRRCGRRRGPAPAPRRRSRPAHGPSPRRSARPWRRARAVSVAERPVAHRPARVSCRTTEPGEVEDHSRDVVDVELQAEGDVTVAHQGRPAAPGARGRRRRARPPRPARHRRAGQRRSCRPWPWPGRFAGPARPARPSHRSRSARSTAAVLRRLTHSVLAPPPAPSTTPRQPRMP